MDWRRTERTWQGLPKNQKDTTSFVTGYGCSMGFRVNPTVLLRCCGWSLESSSNEGEYRKMAAAVWIDEFTFGSWPGKSLRLRWNPDRMRALCRPRKQLRT